MARRKITAEELLARAESNGYKRGAHREQDSARDDKRHGDKTKKDQDSALDRYVLWTLSEMQEDSIQRGLPTPDEASARHRCLREGIEAPDLASMKDFLRYHAATSQGKIVKQPTADSVNTFAEWFFAGFHRVTGTPIDEHERSEVYKWVRRTLVAEDLVVNKKRPKHNFSARDLTRVLRTLWTKDDPIFIPERIGAFFTGGFRYRDIDIVLQRVPDGPWRLIYQINQRWVKNNRDPKNIFYGAAGKDHAKLIYNDAAIFLAMAIADNALYGIKSLDDLRKLEIPPGQDELILIYNEDALDRDILRKCTKAEGLTDARMPKAAFLAIYEKSLKNAGYFCGTSIHTIRRSLGKKVDERYTAVERSQHLTQGDPRVFGQSYVANCSSVDGQGAFLGEPADHRHVEYFQGLKRFREPGLPNELPARMFDNLKRDPQLRSLDAEVKSLAKKDATSSIFRDAKNQLSQYRRTLERDTLSQYQKKWVQDRRAWKILTRGREQARDVCRTDLLQHLCLLRPERGRLAKLMESDDPLSPDDTWRAIEDLYSLCTRDFTVLYLPGHEPVEGACPVACCQLRLEDLHKFQRNHHVHLCVRREMASKLERLQSEIHYCHQCFEWLIGEQWDDHCEWHLSTMTTKRCGSITYCHTLVRPAYCPFCLGGQAPPGAEPLTLTESWASWTRDRKLWAHLDEHMSEVHWPSPCPHPLCDLWLKDTTALQYHFTDDHGLSRPPSNETTRQRREGPCTPGSSASTGPDIPTSNRKRKVSNAATQLEWMCSQTSRQSPTNAKSLCLRSSKNLQGATLSICPRALSNSADQTLGQDIQISSLRTTFDSVEPATSLESEADFQKREWEPNSTARFDGLSADMYLGSDAIFSDYLRSPSPPSLSTPVTEDYQAETTIDQRDTCAPVLRTERCPTEFIEHNADRFDGDPTIDLDKRRV